jgi:hypothetical protein
MVKRRKSRGRRKTSRGRRSKGASARTIARKWAKALGYGFHPDTRGRDYDPPLSVEKAMEYEYDMGKLFSLAKDPYAVARAAVME